MQYPLVNCHSLRTGKIHHFIAGKLHYFDWAIFHCFLYVHQRVNPIKIPLKIPLNHHFPMVFLCFFSALCYTGAHRTDFKHGQNQETPMGFLWISPSFSPGLPDGVEMVHIVLEIPWKPDGLRKRSCG